MATYKKAIVTGAVARQIVTNCERCVAFTINDGDLVELQITKQSAKELLEDYGKKDELTLCVEDDPAAILPATVAFGLEVRDQWLEAQNSDDS